LIRAAALSRSDPEQAYNTLFPHDRTAISYLGPAFFTKYLYFAGAGDAEHPCLILDSRVASALVRPPINWDSLSPNGNWPAPTYSRYLALIQRWRCELTAEKGSTLRADVLERWLFDHGGDDAA
jgi:hypothetical protein